MITFFTTTKAFTGQNKINQENALRNWKYVVPDCEIIVFDEVTGADTLLKELSVIHVKEVKKYSTVVPLPLVNDMFYTASRMSTKSICCFINADILLPSHFVKTISEIHNKLKADYLLVGQRYDLALSTLLDFDGSWEKELRATSNMSLHPPLGSDFFIFPTTQYVPDDIPDLVVGRPGWDNWFIYHGVKIKNLKVIDVSGAFIVYHQNHEQAYQDTGSQFKGQDAATNQNLKYLPPNEEYDYVLATSNYYVKNNRLAKRRLRSGGSLIKRVLRKIKNAVVN